MVEGVNTLQPKEYLQAALKTSLLIDKDFKWGSSLIPQKLPDPELKGSLTYEEDTDVQYRICYNICNVLPERPL